MCVCMSALTVMVQGSEQFWTARCNRPLKTIRVWQLGSGGPVLKTLRHFTYIFNNHSET